MEGRLLQSAETEFKHLEKIEGLKSIEMDALFPTVRELINLDEIVSNLSL